MPPTRILLFTGKGGVGKSTVSVNLAIALQKSGATVGLMDADIHGPSIPKMFGLRDRPAVSPIGPLPVETTTGIKVMSINLLLQSEDQAVIWRGPMIHSALRQFLQDVEWSDLDYLVIDLPPGTGDASLSLAQSLSLTGAVIVLPQGVAFATIAGLPPEQASITSGDEHDDRGRIVGQPSRLPAKLWCRRPACKPQLAGKMPAPRPYG